MLKEIKIYNPDTEETTIIGTDDTCYILDEYDFDTTTYEHNLYRAPLRVGYMSGGSNASERMPVIIGYVIGDKHEDITGTWERYLQDKEIQIRESKRELSRLFSDKNTIYHIIIGDYTLYGYLQEPVKFSANRTENNEVLCRFQLSFNCVSPMFEGKTKTYENIMIFNKVHFGFHKFAFHEKNSPFAVTLATNYRDENWRPVIENNSQIVEGVKVTIKIKSDFIEGINFIGIENNTNETGIFSQDKLEHFVFQKDDIIVMDNTSFDELMYVIRDGEKIDISGNLRSGSDFVFLDVGENNLYIQTLTDKNLAEFKIEFKEHFYMIEDL